jgi:hypothetical protein
MSGSLDHIAVLGAFRSGSSALAGVLHYLGVDMGAPFYMDYYEPEDLSEKLRIWWNQPWLNEVAPKEERVNELTNWIKNRRENYSGPIGAKHPLLSLCGRDLLDAWGNSTKFLWSYRPVGDSIYSLQKLGWWRGSEKYIQTQLFFGCEKFFGCQPCLRVTYSEMVDDPAMVIQGIIDYLELTPTKGQIQFAVQSVRRKV